MLPLFTHVPPCHLVTLCYLLFSLFRFFFSPCSPLFLLFLLFLLFPYSSVLFVYLVTCSPLFLFPCSDLFTCSPCSSGFPLFALLPTDHSCSPCPLVDALVPRCFPPCFPWPLSFFSLVSLVCLFTPFPPCFPFSLLSPCSFVFCFLRSHCLLSCLMSYEQLFV